MCENPKSRRNFLLGAGLMIAGAAAPPVVLGGENPRNEIASTPAPAESAKDARAKKMRGLMVDAARLLETMGYYQRVIDFCSEWECNTVQFRLTDDQGSAMRFTSVPNLVTHRHAFSADQMKALVEYGAQRGVDIIPEIESFGHTGFITRSPSYAHLSDSDSVNGDAEFTGIIPVNPETLALFEKLYREVASIFPSAYLHGGCDEVNWGGSALSRKALQTKGRVEVWAEYLNALNGISVAAGKQFIVWGDFVLHKEPQILDKLQKNIIMDWSYSDTSSATFVSSLQRVSARGSRAIGAPALACYRWGPRVGEEQLRNIDACVDAYSTSADPNALGVVVTNWVPSRYLQSSIWDGFAYAAIAFRFGTATARASAFHRFVNQHYGAEWNEAWAEVFALLYDLTPYRKEKDTATWMGLSLPVPWSNQEQLQTLLRDASPRRNPFTHLRSVLVTVETFVRKHAADFQAFALSVEYLDRMFWREEVVVAQARRPLEKEASVLLIQGIAEHDRALAQRLNADWDSGRFADSPAKLEPIVLLEPSDQLLYQWNLAAAYSASLADQPDRFYQLLQAVNGLTSRA